MLKTVKFGGSSVADGERFANVRNIIMSDPARKLWSSVHPEDVSRRITK